MVTFIEDVLKDLKEKQVDFSNLIFVLPSKRAGVFLKYHLPNFVKQTIFAPEIISIENFVEDLSQLKQLSNVELLFHFYDTYKKVTPKVELESFESFSKWSQILLQDFNEIDRYLVPSNDIFDYLSAIQELNHWSLEEQKTEFVSNYLKFWKRLKIYYNQFNEDLLQSGVAYQGLIYKEAVEHVESYIQNNTKHHIFLGFNALNTSEEQIIQAFLQNETALIYWDIDNTFINDTLHGAGYFTRQHRDNWAYFKKNNFNWIANNYKKEKNITVIGCPKSVGQSKYVGSLLDELSKKNNNLSKTAVVLGEENLLIPVLNAIPEQIKALNVTMGFPLKSIPLATLFEQLFNIHKRNTKRFYFKDVLAVLSNQMVQPVLKSGTAINNAIQKNNLVFITFDELRALAESEDKSIIKLLFEDWDSSIETVLEKCAQLIITVKKALDTNKNKNRLELEYLFRFHTLFNEIINLNKTYNYINDVSTLHSIYKELLSSETLDFKGEPLDGLQIMGMLESRVLDFETVIITSVNEGILPSGKSHNSFIPFDVKLENKLPTYKEKDAVYTYHFYKLIQRAKNIYIIYNTEVDALKGGEKSRFITQLEVEGYHNIKHKIAAPKVPVLHHKLTSIKKDNSAIERLEVIAGKGFSPSSLTNYIRNPLDFYFDKILGIKDIEDVEETVAANTLGSVIHNVLEDFYKPLQGEYLTIEQLKKMKTLIDSRVTHHFTDLYKKGDITTGKNLISFEIAKRYISNFINSEIEALKADNTIKIIAIEVDNTIKINMPELNFPVKLTGKVDRVDMLNGVIRIIDYKSGKVLQNNLEIIDWDTLTSDYKAYSKPFQVLTYAYMMHLENKIKLPVEAGIISFKNLQEGFLKFAKKESTYGKKNTVITEDILLAFEIELKKLILEICNPALPFTEKLLD